MSFMAAIGGPTGQTSQAPRAACLPDRSSPDLQNFSSVTDIMW
jgi:hypothetical protein